MENKKDKKLNWRLLKKLYSIHSPSGKEGKMIDFLIKYIKSLPGDIKLGKDSYGNLYAVKGETNSYPTFCAHLDQVQAPYSRDYKVIETRDMFMGYSPKKHELQGLGADDKNGIFLCLEALRVYDTMKVAFFKEEETGCRGSSNAEMSFFDNSKWVIQADRRGSSDMITSIGCNDLCSEKFIEDINPERWGYKEESGMMTDVEALKNRGLAVSAINLSCGYYNAHTPEESCCKRDLIKCWNLCKHIIEDLTDIYPHIPTYQSSGYDYYSFQDWDLEEDIMDMLRQDPGLTPQDLYDLTRDWYPQITLEQLQNIVTDFRLFYADEDENSKNLDDEYENEQKKDTEARVF